MYETPTADGRCAIEPYLKPGALNAYDTPRVFNQAVNRLNHDCVNRELNGGTIFGTGMSNLALFMSVNNEHVMPIY